MPRGLWDSQPSASRADAPQTVRRFSHTGQQCSATLLNSSGFFFLLWSFIALLKERMKGRRWQAPAAQSDGKLKEEEAGQLRKIQNTPSRKEACMLWFRIKWGQLWLCLSRLLKWSITHVIFCGAAEECGLPCSTEDNKGGSWTLPGGVNCNISNITTVCVCKCVCEPVRVTVSSE